MSTKNAKAQSIELISKNLKNTYLPTIFRPPDGDLKDFYLFFERYTYHFIEV